MWLGDPTEIGALLASMRKYAEARGFKLNPDQKVVTTILEGLMENERRYGHRYCPCRPVTGDEERDAPKICPCEFHLREIEEMGRCACGLFLKGEGDG
jgi:ferredoxin-thioredoxin reductase catalytic subunit